MEKEDKKNLKRSIRRKQTREGDKGKLIANRDEEDSMN